MHCIISSDEVYKDIISKDFFEKMRDKFNNEDDYHLYYKYPIYLDVDDKVLTPSFLVVSPNGGVVIINCFSENNLDKIAMLDEQTSDIENYLFSKFVKSTAKILKESKRELSFELRSVLFLPFLSQKDISNCKEYECTVCSKMEEVFEIITNSSKKLTAEMQKEICAILEGSKVILKPKQREIADDDKSSKGSILKQMEDQIAYLDLGQKKAALAQIKGPQRIRGLAGSGKTIILCMKAALIHLREPNKKILYTFTTRSLYDYIETLIIRFYRYFGDGNLPDFDKIQIKHSWGGTNLSGVYYSTCRKNNVLPLTFDQAKALPYSDPFDAVCMDLLQKTKGEMVKEYDYVLIDEAQDFRPSFYQLCRAIVKDDCLVWCYDDLQNIFDVKIQDTMLTFKNEFGAEGIDLEKLNEQYEDLNNDVVLAKTYRNPLEILVLAHAIGFGIYNTRLIQTLENNQHWRDFGYEVIKGDCRNGDKMEISRPKENSPLLISEKQTPQEIIQIKSYSNFNEEIDSVAKDIINNIENENLLPDDIIVITLDDKNSKYQLKCLSDKLRAKGIETFNLSDRSYSKGFIEEGCVSLSTVYRAKGNEAALVYVIGTQVFENNSNRRSMRNRIFTAFTRAKGWLRISGENIKDGKLWSEIGKVFDNEFTLKFVQNDPLYIIERDKKKTSRKKQAQKIIKEMKDLDLSPDELKNMLIELGEK